MNKTKKIVIAILIILALVLNYSVVFATQPEMPSEGIQNGQTPPDKPDGEMPGGNGQTPPDKPDGNGGGPGGNSNTAVSHNGATEISTDTESSDGKYSSIDDSQNTLLVTDGTSTLTNPTVTKSGDSDGDSSDFYGTNAAVLVKGGTLNIKGGTVTTNGSHANGVFAYSSGIINVSDTTIKTSSNNSGAIMVTGGGTLTANNVTAETDGNSSAPIRSDRGGGTLTVNGGSYTSHGTGSPAIYSTADITVNDATLTSTASEGVVVEGKNSVTLNNTTLEASNTSLNGNSETYKAIFIYQSMSGDADVGTASFTAKNSKIVNNKGDIIYVTNTNTVIELENNEITNNDTTGGFLRISAAKWGTTGSNGGTVTLNAKNQVINGNIYVDSISTLELSLKNGSSYVGTINGEKSAKSIAITLDSSSSITLTGDSYVTSLSNEVANNSNINLNGYTLYVNGTAINSTNYTGSVVTTNTADATDSANSTGEVEFALKSDYILPLVLVVVIIGITIAIKSIFKGK